MRKAGSGQAGRSGMSDEKAEESATRRTMARNALLLACLVFPVFQADAQTERGPISSTCFPDGSRCMQVALENPVGVEALDAGPSLQDRAASAWLMHAVAREARRLSGASRPRRRASSSLKWQEAAPEEEEGWIGRHPVAFGALVGLGAGFTIGFGAGDDGVFADFQASFNGIILGAVGAVVGAKIGSRWN